VVRATFDFLGEPWEPEVLRFNAKPHDFGTGDPEAQVLRGFRPSIGNWKRWNPEHVATATEHLQRYMEPLGYSNLLTDHRTA